jgi:hypothetical protein
MIEIAAGFLATIGIVGLGYATRQGEWLPFYSTVLIVIALAYVLFAAMAGVPRTIVAESTVAAVFIAGAVMGARWSNGRAAGLLIAAGLAVHGAYDLVHDALVENPVVPEWWPVFCAVVDLLLAGWVAALAARNRLAPQPPSA